MLREHLVTGSGDALAQLRVALGARLQAKQDERFPLSAYHVGGRFYRAGIEVHDGVCFASTESQTQQSNLPITPQEIATSAE